MSDHPVRSCKLGVERQIGPHSRPEAADTVFDMSRTQTLGSLNRRDHIRRVHPTCAFLGRGDRIAVLVHVHRFGRSEEHTSELQSLMRISYAVFCLKKKNTKQTHYTKRD